MPDTAKKVHANSAAGYHYLVPGYNRKYRIHLTDIHLFKTLLDLVWLYAIARKFYYHIKR